MAVYGAGAYRTSPGRGASPGFRFTVYALLAVALMFLDRRGGWLVHVRYYLSGAAYPLQLAVSSPTNALGWMRTHLATREALEGENAQLHEQQKALELRTMRFDALVQENAELRGLKQALPPVADRWLAAEVVNVELNALSHRLLINRGSRNGVFKGQAVMDGAGILGQTTRVGPWSSEVILVTDPEHAIPVQIERTGLRTIAEGTGDTEALGLPFLPANADVKVGDVLITSGLGGVFPEGYPVAKVTEIRHDAVQPLAQIRATPLSHLDRLHEVMLVWFAEDHPAAPVHLGADGLDTGNPALQSQPAPGLIPVAPPSVPRLGGGSAATKSEVGRHAESSAPAARRRPASSAPAAGDDPDDDEDDQ